MFVVKIFEADPAGLLASIFRPAGFIEFNFSTNVPEE
jgi:hypothetical protein